MRAAWQPSHQRKQPVQVLREGGGRRPGGALPVPVPPALLPGLLDPPGRLLSLPRSYWRVRLALTLLGSAARA
jgi:hypothetical protein